jgi:hypothetical protein
MVGRIMGCLSRGEYRLDQPPFGLPATTRMAARRCSELRHNRIASDNRISR